MDAINRFIVLILALMVFPVAQAEKSPEPEIVISAGDDERIKEYRANGRLYMIEVVPTKGPHYFLVDSDGDGQLETRRNNIGSGILIPSWVLISW